MKKERSQPGESYESIYYSVLTRLQVFLVSPKIAETCKYARKLLKSEHMPVSFFMGQNYLLVGFSFLI